MVTSDIEIKFSITPKVSGTYNWQDKETKLIFSPDDPLEYNTNYSVILSASIMDLEGNYLKNELKWSFITEKQNDSKNEKEEPDQDDGDKKDKPNAYTWIYAAIGSILIFVVLFIIIFFIIIAKKKEAKQRLSPVEPETFKSTKSTGQEITTVGKPPTPSTKDPVPSQKTPTLSQKTPTLSQKPPTPFQKPPMPSQKSSIPSQKGPIPFPKGPMPFLMDPKNMNRRRPPINFNQPPQNMSRQKYPNNDKKSISKDDHDPTILSSENRPQP